MQRAHHRHGSALVAAARALAAVIASLEFAAAADSPEWHYVGCRAEETEGQQYPPRPFAAGSALADSPIAGIFHGCRECPLSYRFALPEGTYHLRLHYLKVQGGKTRNNASFAASANGSAIIAHSPMWVPLMTWPDGLPKEIPADAVAKVQEADVATRDGRIDLAFPHAFDQAHWGICGIELIGPGRTERIRCGSDEPYTDAQGYTWEPDGPHRQPIPDTGAFTIAKIDRETKGKWVDV
jgi:hypothetical protein